jgi:hypothetical protein
MPLAAGVDLGDVAYLVLFVVVGIIELVRRVLQGRHAPRQDPRPAPTPGDGADDGADEDRPTPRHTAPPATPRPAATHAEALGETEPTPGSPPGARTAIGAALSQIAAASTVFGRPTAVGGKALLHGHHESRRDRVRQALLWREVLAPPPSLRGAPGAGRRRR